MGKLWAGRTDGTNSQIAEEFNSSISFDRKMFRQDIKGSIAHAKMLALQSIITDGDADNLCGGLQSILDDLENGKLTVDPGAEDIHTFVEQELTNRIGETGKKLHTARSRNDQVALDLRLYLRDEAEAIKEKIRALILTVTEQAETNKSTIMPGYTHLQRAQPITFGHHLMAYAMMFLRDLDRLTDAEKRMNVSPIGSCALAGTTYPTDRFFEAKELGFDDVCRNSIDGVADRDFCVELLSCFSLLMVHLSRFAEEIVLWSSLEFGFVELSDAFTTGSSIMPQKKNSDMAELVRGKTGRVYGDLIALLTLLKGLPLAYNKDLQEDKESVFDACETVRHCLDVFDGMVATMKAKPDVMRAAAQKGFINATDLADYLVRKGLPFRDAYKISGKIVADCLSNGKILETMTVEDYRIYSPLVDEDVFDAVDLDHCVERRCSFGGTGVKSVESQIAWVRGQLK